MESSSGGGGGGISSIIQSTKTKLLVLSSLLGVGAIYYFTRNYLRNGQLIPSWTSETTQTSKIKSKQPKVIGGLKRAVSIKEDHSEHSNAPFNRQRSRSRRSSVSSRKGSSVRGILKNSSGNTDVNLNKAIYELDSSLLEIEQIFELDTERTNIYNKHQSINHIPLIIQDELKRIRNIIDYAQDIKLVSQKSTEYVNRQKQLAIENDIEGITSEELNNENYNDLVEYIRNQKNFSEDEYDSDNDSFISATESVDALISENERLQESLVFEKSLKDLVSKNNKQDFYMQGIEYLTHYGVPVRTIRTTLLNCDNEIDFSIKVYCIRRAFKDLLKKTECRQWFIIAGKEMLVNLLKKNKCDATQFAIDFDKMIEYCENTDNWSAIDEELSNRGVCCLNFYDIVLDFMIMDSFEDLSTPPSSVVAAVQNRWLSTRIKETALSTAIWTVIKSKKRMLKNSDGFYSKFYDVSMHITPMLAWGFLGPVKELNELCGSFKKSVVGFLQDIFSTERANYKSVQTLADDIFQLAKRRKEELMTLLA